MEDNDDEGDDDNNADDDNPDEDEDDDERVAHLGQCGLKQRCQDEQWDHLRQEASTPFDIE